MLSETQRNHMEENTLNTQTYPPAGVHHIEYRPEQYQQPQMYAHPTNYGPRLYDGGYGAPQPK